VAQVAPLRRQLSQHAGLSRAGPRRQAPEVVAWVTKLPPDELDAARWLAAHRAA